MELHDRAGTDLQGGQAVQLLVAASIHPCDPRCLADLQLGERHDDLLHVSGRDLAAFSLRDGKPVRALSRVAQERADPVHDLRGQDVLELAGSRLELPAQHVVDQSFADPVGADEPLRVGGARTRKGERLCIPPHHSVLLESFQVSGVEPAFQGYAQSLDGRGASLAELPEPFQHFLPVGDSVHSPSAPPAEASRARTAPVYRKEAA